ncbi:hypothetical protein [Embleya sp. AB8]|uniref:hypothetical protein n=1 Tax=Embleya sp. AB8 TaxID=3156304 RepID=UPI003C743668
MSGCIPDEEEEVPCDVGDFVWTFHPDGDQIGSGHVVDVDVPGGTVTVEDRDGRRRSFPFGLVEAPPVRRDR